MFGNPKGEVIICDCKRTHDILRGTMCFCACGNQIVSKEYIPPKNITCPRCREDMVITFVGANTYGLQCDNNLCRVKTLIMEKK